MSSKINIVGGGICGATLAALLPNSKLYEREKLGGLCRDNKNYQDFIHVLHTDNENLWKFINAFTLVRPHETRLGAYHDGKTNPHPPKKITNRLYKKRYKGYSQKMWLSDPPKEAKSRITTSPDGLIFHEKYQGIPDFTRLFKNLTKFTDVIKKDVRDGDLKGTIILTGAIDEYFNYCYGPLPYRGMKSVHYESEVGLDGDFVTFSDPTIPFQRLVDYSRLGFDGRWIGVEIACDAKHYPIRDEESEKLYAKYQKLALKKGVILCGRLATYKYLDMDEVIEQAFKVAQVIKECKL